MNEITLPFVGFPKIPRLSREVVITEKIDGTNAQIFIPELPQETEEIQKMGFPFYVGSRTRWITPGADNSGFARWAYANAEEILKLGPGHHFGEWWGQGIQRNYGLKEKRFSLFNTGIWVDRHTLPIDMAGCSLGDRQLLAPECVHVVPVIASGIFSTGLVEYALQHLASKGSLASPGFDNPEGIVIFHTASNYLFKKTIKGDEKGKET
jgi:hypothetical protein